MSKFERKQTKKYYIESGEIHISEISNLAICSSDYSLWPTDPVFDYFDFPINYSKKFCDKKGIPRDGMWCKIGDLMSKINEKQADHVFNNFLYKVDD